MSELSARLSLPYLQAAQAQKHVTHNEALERLDLLVQLSVQSFNATTPPAAPEEGQIWALGASPSGDWAMHPYELAAWSNGGWLFIAPREGWRAALGGELRLWTGAGWEPPQQALDNLPGLGIMASHDATNRLVVSADAALFTHDGGGHQLKINKAEISDTASMLFQTGWSGRAEMGLAGEDDFTFKVSANGSTWQTAIAIGSADGAVHFPQSVQVSGTITGELIGNVTGDLTGAAVVAGGSIDAAPIGNTTPSTGAFTELSAGFFQGFAAEDIEEAVLDYMEQRTARQFRLGEQGALFAPSPNTTYTDTAGTTPASVGDPVARMDDLSGNGNHAVQATLEQRPVLRQSAEGLYYLEFDGVDDRMSTVTEDFMTGVAATSVQAVQRISSAGDTMTYRAAAGTSTGHFTFRLWDTSYRLTIYQSGGTATHVTAGNISSPTVALQHGAGSNWTTRTNGNQVATRSTGQDLHFDVQASGQRLHIGHSGTGTGLAEMNLYGLLFINRDLTTAEMTRTERYMAARTGVTL